MVGLLPFRWRRALTYLEQYLEEARAGRVVIGRELRIALEKYVSEMCDPRFVYDTKEADFRMAFMERFCKLTKSPFYGKPMKLMLWQKAFIECLYSFKWRDTGNDRFKKVLLIVGRKNGKTEVVNALAFTELMVGARGSDIVCSSNDDIQANILYLGIDTMRKLFDPENKRTKKNISNIWNRRTDSKIFKITQKTQNKEGRNIDLALLDEVHELKTNDIYKSLEQSQSIKVNPKLICITTEGFVNDGLLDELTKQARATLNDEIDNPSFMVWMYTQDSEQEVWQNPDSWYKSNPSLGVVKRRDYLEDQLKISRISKADRTFVLCKDFNIKQNTSESWLLIDDYIYPMPEYKPENFTGCVCLGGVDLSETTDLTVAHLLVTLPNDSRKFVLSHYWIPQTKLEVNADSSGGAKYREWAEKGYLTVCEGNDIDVRLVADWFADLCRTYRIKIFKVGYDNRFARPFVERLEDYGIDSEMVYQNAQTMSNPMKILEADFKSRNVQYSNNPITQWCLGNTCAIVDNLGRCMAMKINNQAIRRIDGAVALIIAYATLYHNRGEYCNYSEVNKIVDT